MGRNGCRNVGLVMLLTAATLAGDQAVLRGAGSAPIFGPVDVVRATGAPVPRTFTFNVPAPVGDYVVCLANGGSARQYPPVTSARVSLNGTDLFRPEDFKNVYALLARRTGLASINQLVIELASQPRSGVTVSIQPGTSCVGRPPDNRPPAITSAPVTSGTLLEPYTYPLAATDPDGDAIHYSLATAPLGMTINATTGVLTWLPPGTGALSVVAVATDAGGASTTQAFVVNVGTAANRPPHLATIPNRRVPAGVPFQLELSADDPDPGDVVTFTLVSGPAGASIAGGHTVRWTPTLADLGPHAFGVTARDSAGASASGSFNVEVVNSNGAPVLDPLPDAVVSAAAQYSRTVSATDPNPGDALTFALASGPAGLSLTPSGQMAWTPTTAQYGAYRVAVTVTDQTGLADAAAFTIAVDAAQLPQPPVAMNDRYGVRKGTTLNVPPPGVLGNDIDPQGRPLTAQLVAGPTKGSLTLGGDGSVSYTPAPTTNASTQPALAFSHSFNDGTGALISNREQPLVVDLNGDGKAEIVYLGASVFANRRLVAVHGGTNTVAWAVNAYQPAGTPKIVLCFTFCQLSAGDLNGDGHPEIISVHSDDETTLLRRKLIAFNADGSYRWTSDDILTGDVTQTIGMFTTALADLDGDGASEIIAVHSGKTTATPSNVVSEDLVTVFNSNGHIRWTTRVPGRPSSGRVVVADIDVDGRPDIVIGGAVLNVDGTIRWNSKVSVSFGSVDIAVGNLDGDAFAELVYTDVFQNLYRFEHTGAQTWGPIKNPTLSNFSDVAIGDVDGDGRAEILMARDAVEVWSPAGVLLRTMPLPNGLLGYGGTPTIFDLNGDGRPEVIYHGARSPLDVGSAQGGLYIFDGPTGALLHVLYATRDGGDPGTLPIVADVNGDGTAEIVTGGWNEATMLRVFQAASGSWALTRPIWNQPSYHVTNVDADGGVPAHEPINWLTPGLNNFRVNALLPFERTRDHDTFTYVAANGIFTSNVATVALDILPPNSAPQILSTAPPAAAPGLEYLYAVIATDPDPGETLAFSVPVAPAGMTVDPVTGLVRWTPAVSASGSVTAVVKATDSQGESSSQSFVITLAAAALVPSVIGQPVAGAPGALAAVGLSVGIITHSPSRTDPVNTVMSQDPLPGSLVPQGALVDLVVSSGPAPVAVPALVGRSEFDALARLSSAGFSAAVTRAFSSTIARGRVIAQSPAPGTPLVPGTVNVTISAGSGLVLRLKRNFTTANTPIAFTVAAQNLAGIESPAPPLTVAVTPARQPAFGPVPSVVGTTVVPAVGTRGAYRLTATDPATGRTTSVSFAVTFPPQAGLRSMNSVFASMSDALADIDAIGAQARAALALNDQAAMRAALDQMVQRWRQVDTNLLRLSTPFTLPQGYFPAPSDLASLGLAPTADDLLAVDVFNDAIADLEAWTAGLREPSTSMITLKALADQFNRRAARLSSLTPSEWGVIKTAPLITVLVSESYPAFFSALMDELAAVVAHSAPPGGGPAVLMSSLAEELVVTAVQTIVDEILEESNPLLKFRSDALQNAAWGAAAVVAANHFKTQVQGQSATAIVAGASLMFHIFNAPDSFIEADLDSDNALNSVVVTIGPDQVEPMDFSEETAVIDAAQTSSEIGEAMMKVYDFIRNGNASGVAEAVSGSFQGRGVGYRGCLFSSSPTCSQLVFPNGFKSVYTYNPPTGFAGFSGLPIPIIFLVFDKTHGVVYVDTPVFLPYQPPPPPPPQVP